MKQQSDQNIWESVLMSMRRNVDDRSINMWLKLAKLSANRKDAITITVANKFIKNQIDKEYLSLIQNILKDEWSIDGTVYVQVDELLAPKIKTNAKKENPTENNNLSTLDSMFTFENFVACASNAFAHSTAIAVAEGNFSFNNPLYIYGDTGLGKTHLMYAAANRIRKNFPKMTILYMSGITFIEEFVTNHRLGSLEKLTERFRSVDLFMLDDIQALKDADATRRFFFNTFNDLQMRQKQVIMTSDESPQEIEMEDRMRSRIASGVQAKINPPVTEERAAILMQKATDLGIALDVHHALFLAENAAARNGRTLLGALKHVYLYANFHKTPITEALVKEALTAGGMIRKADKVVSPQELITAVSDMLNVKLPELTSKKRTPRVVFPRQIAMFLMKEKLGLSLKEIGSYFGGKDHSTVRYGVESIKEQIGKDDHLAGIISKISAKVFG